MANILVVHTKKQARILEIRMVVHGQLIEPAVCLSDLYVFLLDIVRGTRQNLWTMIYRSQ